jgi:hypothetical protein
MGWNVTDLLPQLELRTLLLILRPIDPATFEARGHTVRSRDEKCSSKHLQEAVKLSPRLW